MWQTISVNTPADLDKSKRYRLWFEAQNRFWEYRPDGFPHVEWEGPGMTFEALRQLAMQGCPLQVWTEGEGAENGHIPTDRHGFICCERCAATKGGRKWSEPCSGVLPRMVPRGEGEGVTGIPATVPTAEKSWEDGEYWLSMPAPEEGLPTGFTFDGKTYEIKERRVTKQEEEGVQG